jgi:hypothetical protein
MADFHLWAVIRQTDPAEFVVFVSTISHEPDPPCGIQSSVDTAANSLTILGDYSGETGEKLPLNILSTNTLFPNDRSTPTPLGPLSGRAP